jgi:hypothetical protein
LLGFDNLPLFVLRRSFTAIELLRLTDTPTRQEGWNMPLVKKIQNWLNESLTQLRSTNWPEIWAPEKVQARIKQDTGYYLGDQVPTIDTFDIYGYVDDGKDAGWIRRIVLDSWGAPVQNGLTGVGKPRFTMNRKNRTDIDGPSDFLFTSKNRKVAYDWKNIITFQFADLSACFPQYYHEIRSLGWLLYAPCHLQMRMRCKFYESVFEALLMLFEVDSMDDAQNALKLNLINRGFIDRTIKPVKATDRWQVNSQLVELGLRDLSQVITENSAAYTQNPDYSANRTQKTKFQVMSEMNAVTSLVGVALNQAYKYEVFEDREIFRRFLKANSTDPAVNRARARMIKRGVNPKYLIPECWDVEHERVMGNGNKSQEMMIAEWLMSNRPAFDPDSQRVILRDATLAVTDNPDKAWTLVPEEPEVSDSVHDAQLAASGLLMGLPSAFKSGVNHQEYAAALIGSLSSQVQKINQRGGVPTPDELNGMQNLAGQSIQGQEIKGNGIAAHIKALEGDEEMKQQAKKLNDIFGKLMNQVRAFAQRLQEAMQKQQQQNGNGQPDAKTMAKIQADQMAAQQKMQERKTAHAQRTAQRQIQFEQQMKQDKEQHAADLAKTDLEAASNIRRNRLTSQEE